jgi:hypothetical protein
MKTASIFRVAGFSGLLFLVAMAPDSSRKTYGDTVTAADLRKHLNVLASDDYEGRETGEKGQKMSAEYIADQFRSFGIPELKTGGYYQNVNLLSFTAGEGTVACGGKKYAFGKDFYYTAGAENIEVSATELVFAGYGINDKKYSDYSSGFSAKDKVLMILAGDPVDKKGNSLITGTAKKSDWSSQRRMKINEARKSGASVLLIVQPEYEKAFNDNRHAIESPTLQLDMPKEKKERKGMAVIYISKAMADELLQQGSPATTIDALMKRMSKKKKTARLAKTGINFSVVINRIPQKVVTENVLGYLEGSDLKEELIVITAHYDHLGKHNGVVYNGADDDGSGTVAVIELAEAFAKAKKDGHGPRRSILFMAVSGEEKGLLGSSWYAENPVFPLANTICDLNIDMIGRVDKEHLNDSNYVYVIGSDMLSSELKGITETANTSFTQIKLDYRFDAPDDPNFFYYRSDHYNFARKNIPVAFFFNGVHDDYHQETDEISKIAFDLMERRTRLVFYTAWELANREKRITADKKK